MAKKTASWTDEAQKYRGKNTTEVVRQGTGIPGLDSVRPHLIHPGGRTFADQWVNPPGGKAKEKG